MVMALRFCVVTSQWAWTIAALVAGIFSMSARLRNVARVLTWAMRWTAIILGVALPLCHCASVLLPSASHLAWIITALVVRFAILTSWWTVAHVLVWGTLHWTAINFGKASFLAS